MKYIGIVGARKYRDKQSVVDLVHSLPKDSIIITSSCRGVCTWAAESARAAGFEVRVYAPDLRNIRNRHEMVERYYSRNRELIAACEVVHAFISKEGGYTGGTRYEIRYANRLKKYVFEHWESEEVKQRGQMSLPFEEREEECSAGWKRVFAESLA
ncbi:hypothetical protein DSCO28_02810 [Desulfosarcina ovata subsp. sediminis]|uniref:DUF2493 domain-containing protein n=1 Tax=Desulfosarcina ovata subsp. sediminis TaxID=885957 RepID=A0A5K7ZHH1_9BACT|nr:hypothetical protein [Desulfosarcina ovata]BBO79715.1 hypothetical protein DSCO28_02810 [Desulfosarcina ovata subsp. sediminis]